MSSLSFAGTASSYLRIPNTDNFDFGAGDFTIEWYQYQTDSNSFPRIFQVGNYPNTNIGVSIESGTFIFWHLTTYTMVTTLSSSDYKNKWVHFAICRASGVRKVYMNGTSISSVSDSFNYNGNSDLVIGNETTPTLDAAFGGYMAYFSWVKGTAVYTANFTVSNTYPSTTGNTVLMLSANGGAPNFAGTLGGTVVNNSVSTVANVPTGFSSQQENILCFREGTKITCLVSGHEKLVPIESMRKGTLVKTYFHGYVPVEVIKSSKIYNPSDNIRSKNRLYKLSPSRYPELTQPLYLTGCHSILENYISEEENEETLRLLCDLFITDNKYRLMACIDKRATPYQKSGIYTIWHFALETDDSHQNYGVYANGLLVESCSKVMMNEYFH
jgi:hypothetical protein